MASAFPNSEDDVRSRAGSLGWQLTRYAPNNLAIEGVVIDATLILLDRGAQHAMGWLVASCGDDDGVDRIVRPKSEWLGASRRVGESKLWLHVTDGDRAAAELLAMAPIVPSGLGACVAHFRAGRWVIADDDVLDDTYDFTWQIRGTFPSARSSGYFQIGLGRTNAPGRLGEARHDSSGGAILSSPSGDLYATIYSGALAEELADTLIQPACG